MTGFYEFFFHWTDHIDAIFKKANQRFYALKQLKPLMNTVDLHTTRGVQKVRATRKYFQVSF